MIEQAFDVDSVYTEIAELAEMPEATVRAFCATAWAVVGLAADTVTRQTVVPVVPSFTIHQVYLPDGRLWYGIAERSTRRGWMARLCCELQGNDCARHTQVEKLVDLGVQLATEVWHIRHA